MKKGSDFTPYLNPHPRHCSREVVFCKGFLELILVLVGSLRQALADDSRAVLLGALGGELGSLPFDRPTTNLH